MVTWMGGSRGINKKCLEKKVVKIWKYYEDRANKLSQRTGCGM